MLLDQRLCRGHGQTLVGSKFLLRELERVQENVCIGVLPLAVASLAGKSGFLFLFPPRRYPQFVTRRAFRR